MAQSGLAATVVECPLPPENYWLLDEMNRQAGIGFHVLRSGAQIVLQHIHPASEHL